MRVQTVARVRPDDRTGLAMPAQLGAEPQTPV